MTAKKGFKKLVRERAEKTGESYATARMRLLAGDEPSRDVPGDPLVFYFPWESRVYAHGRVVEEITAEAMGFYRAPTDPGAPLLPVGADELPAVLGHQGPIPPLIVPGVDREPLLLDEPGLVIVSGRGGTGMTALTTLLAASTRDRSTLTRVDAPEGGYQGHPATWGRIFEAVLRSPLPYHFIDSMRLLTVVGGRPFVKDGIPLAFFRLLAELAWLARASNRLVIASTNPMVGSSEAHERFRDRLRNSGASVIETRSCEVSRSGERQLDARMQVHVWFRREKRAWEDRLVRLQFDDASALDDPWGSTTPLALELDDPTRTEVR